jgi:hypothetical protein
VAIDLASIKTRVRNTGIFAQVHDVLALADAMANPGAVTKQAFVVASSEIAEDSRTVGVHRQRVEATISVAFVLAAQRTAQDRSDEVEAIRSALKSHLAGWQPEGAEHALQYRTSKIGSIAQGLVWVELVFRTRYLFSPPPDFGPELVTNGGFDSGDGWTLSGSGGGTPTISGGRLNGGGAGEGTAIQTVAIEAGKIYRLSYTIVSMSTGQVDVELGLNVSAQRTLPGDYAEYIVAGPTGLDIAWAFTGSTDAVIDNASLKEVTVQDDYGPELWPQPAFVASTGLTLTPGASVAGGKLLFNATGSLMRAHLISPSTIVNNDVFHYDITIDSSDGGSPTTMGFGGRFTSSLNVGSHSGNLVSFAASQILEVRDGGDSTAVIDNVSIKKVILPVL